MSKMFSTYYRVQVAGGRVYYYTQFKKALSVYDDASHARMSICNDWELPSGFVPGGYLCSFAGSTLIMSK